MNRKLFWMFVSGSLLALSVWFILTVNKLNQTKLVFCDVGQGNGVLMIRGEFQLVYDTGPRNGKMLDCLASNMPFWDKTIEVVIVSHWDNDHSGGLSEIDDYYKISNLYSSKNNEQYNYTHILALEDVIRNSWMEFKVVWTDDSEEDNYGSVVGLLSVGEFKVLLMGDVPIEVEQRLVWRKMLTEKIDILLVGHHGSRGSTSEDLLEVVKPDEAIISVGKNSFGHPTKEVIDRLGKFYIRTRRTDKEGTIIYTREI